MIITRKIEIKPDVESEKILKTWYNLMPRLHNTIVTNIFLNDLIREKMANYDTYFQENISKLDNKITAEYDKLKGCKDKTKRDKGLEVIDKLKKERNKINFEGKKQFDKQFKEVFGKNFNGFVYNIVRQDEILSEIPAVISSMALNNLGYYVKSINAIKNGTERIKMYGKGMPIPIPSSNIKLEYNANDEKFDLTFPNKVSCTMFFGRDKSNNRVIVERIFDKIYRLADSQIQFKKGKWFLLTCVDIPQENKKLDEAISVGVDLGIAVPAVCAVSNTPERLFIGNHLELLKMKTQIRNRRRRVQSSLQTSNGGKGRKKKLQALDRFSEFERNWTKNYNHNISKKIIEFAVNNKAKYINMELLEGFGKDESGEVKTKFKMALSNWSYYELQTMIKYKAEKYGIVVRYIDPFHTSQVCSVCGNYQEKQRIIQAEFVCGKCGEKLNADYNAAKNISMSNKFVDKRQDCTYYKIYK